jgi:hypothetical protein
MQAKESVNLSQLAAFAAAFKAKVHAAYVDISDASVFSVIEEYPDALSLKENVIVRSKGFGSYAERDFLDKTVNRHFTDDVRKHLHECAAL